MKRASLFQKRSWTILNDKTLFRIHNLRPYHPDGLHDFCGFSPGFPAGMAKAEEEVESAGVETTS